MALSGSNAALSPLCRLLFSAQRLFEPWLLYFLKKFLSKKTEQRVAS
jgi:hypothetical protein